MILMNDFKAEPIEIRHAMQATIQRVLESGWYVLGKELETFEQLWANICDVSYGVGVGNGMDAIEIALRAANIGKGDEVITTPMTAFASILAIIRAGATPVLADIDPETALLDPASVKRCLSKKSKALLLVHLYGQVRQMDVWQNLCHEAGLILIEDCAQAHLATWQGAKAGGFGLAGAYSFYPTKNLGALGDAGMLVTDDAELAKRAMCLRNYGQSQRYHHPELGLNSRLDELQAALLSERLKWLPEFTETRRKVAASYQAEITNPKVRLLAKPQETDAHVYHLFVLNTDHRDALIDHLKINGVQSLIHYPISIHQQPPCLDIGRDPNGLTHSEHHANTCLSLPCHPQLSEIDVAKIVNAVNSF